MSQQPGSSNSSEGQPEKKPFPRLSSFKLPRDLTLSAGTVSSSKANKKVFTPNLNVVRNKSKTVAPNLKDNKKEDRNRKERQNNKNKFNGPAVVKSSGVFSEGIGASERPSSRAPYTRDVDAAPTLQRPVLRQKNIAKVDKELEDQKIKKILGQSHLTASDDEDDDSSVCGARDAPIRLPISAGGNLYTRKKLPKVTKADIVIKKEPVDEDMIVNEVTETKHYPEAAVSAFDSTDIVRLLTGDKPKIMLLQLPDNLPGRGPEEDIAPHKKKSDPNVEADTKTLNGKCKLSDLEEGKIGKIQIYKSGKVKLVLGDTIFDLSLGTQPSFRQDVISIAIDPDNKTGTMINLGGIERKLNVIPDWETLFKDVAI